MFTWVEGLGCRQVTNLSYFSQGQVKGQFLHAKGQASCVAGGYISHWGCIDAKSVKTITIVDLDGASVGQSIVITAVRGIGQYGKLAGRDKATFFPFVDRFGQFKHETWQGKVKSLDDLKNRIAVETTDIKENPGPNDRSAYGGWAKGPRLKATGHFRTEKHQGKWWLVDPEGYLFWSHGITGLRGVANQGQRAYAYEHYVKQALKHPHIVGTHWFQLREQNITGREDGENYQIGFVDICDTPYQEIIDVARRVGQKIYQLRSEEK